MEPQPIVKKYSFSKEEHDKLQSLHIGITASNAALDGMQIYKNVILGGAYKRLGIDTEPSKEWTKSISYNLANDEITYTRTPKREEPKEKVAKK